MVENINKVMLIGNVGGDPNIIKNQDGSIKVVSFDFATSDYDAKNKKTRTQWHRIVVYGQALANIAQERVKPKSKLFIEGRLSYRKFIDKVNNERVAIEIALYDYNGCIVVFDE